MQKLVRVERFQVSRFRRLLLRVGSVLQGFVTRVGGRVRDRLAYEVALLELVRDLLRLRDQLLDLLLALRVRCVRLS